MTYIGEFPTPGSVDKRSTGVQKVICSTPVETTRKFFPFSSCHLLIRISLICHIDCIPWNHARHSSFDSPLEYLNRCLRDQAPSLKQG